MDRPTCSHLKFGNVCKLCYLAWKQSFSYSFPPKKQDWACIDIARSIYVPVYGGAS